MIADIRTQEGRLELYGEHRRALEEIIARSEAHEASEPDCPARPLCIGGDSLLALARHSALHSEHPIMLLIVAVQEISDLRRRLEATTS